MVFIPAASTAFKLIPDANGYLASAVGTWVARDLAADRLDVAAGRSPLAILAAAAGEGGKDFVGEGLSAGATTARTPESGFL